MKPSVHARTLTDGSVVFDVEIRNSEDNYLLTFGCQDQEHAYDLSVALSKAGYIDVDRG